MIEFASFAVFLSIFCFDDVIALININFDQKFSTETLSFSKGVPGKIQEQKFVHFLIAFIILGLRVRNGTKLIKRDRL